MATIVKTPSGTWKALVRKQGWPTAAKTFRTKRDAEDWSRRTEDSMVRGVYIERAPSERLTLSAALDRYLAEVTPTKKPSTQRAEQVRAATLRSHFGKYSLAAITAEMVAAFRDKRLTKGKTNNTVRLDLALLGHLFTTAIREWRLGLIQNPVANIRKPSAGKGRDRRLSGSEEKRLRKAVAGYSNPMLGWIFEIALETCMRSGEIVGLRLGQVDVARRIVRLADTKNDTARTIPMTKAAQAAFIQALANPVRPEGCDLVFFGEPGRDGVRRPYNFNKAWIEIKSKLGLGDFRFHDLRHEAVSRLVEGGLSDQEVAAISGHKSMQMLRRYTHLRAEDLVGKLDEFALRR
jgi:integrase